MKSPKHVITQLPDLSHLEELHLIRPSDPNKLLDQLFQPNTTQNWSAIRKLTLESKKINLIHHFESIMTQKEEDIQPQNQNNLISILGQLNSLTISGIISDVLSNFIQPYCTENLTYLYLVDIDMQLIDLIPQLANLKALEHLRIYFDVNLTTSQWKNLMGDINFRTIKKLQQQIFNHLPQLTQCRVLHMENCDLIHQKSNATQLIYHCFPALHHLILERDSRMIGFNCFRCAKNDSIYLNELCRQRFITSLLFNNLTRLSLNHELVLPQLNRISVQVKETFLSEEKMFSDPIWLDQYEVYDRLNDKWRNEMKAF